MGTVKLYSLSFKQTQTYLFAALFVLGNIVLPQLCHLIPKGGFIFLPIYFFTLIGAYKYGIRVGILTAILSPIINSMLFGMPVIAMLPIILIKSTLLAVAAAFIAHRFNNVSLLLMFAVIASYQLIGSLAEWAITGSLSAAIQDVRLGIPGLLIQIFGGFAFLKYVIRR